MINVNRNPKVPEYLSSPDIQEYIKKAQSHLEDPDGVHLPEKPLPYRHSDLLEAFDNDFYAKCYLTEEAFTNSWIMDIEHFTPQAERPDLVYEWTNLFPASHLANMMKPRKTPEGGYLNPADPNENVEKEIFYMLSPYGKEPEFEPVNSNNVKAMNTCNLLERVHNGHDANSKKATLSLRHAIQKKYIDILNKICEWQNAEIATIEKEQAAKELKSLLSRKSSFTMLCRSIPAVRKYVPIEFLD
jgi:hypothetical protein